ncbi:MAG TPA: prepilin-type N-terminal cleavage/methylation domain-containing protein [Fimbriimonadaceae bacterium]|nr:prepilin-type N-terminal cleavage/methylation domain-containing protein [Fimbriimonadaceae bacterium]
MAKRGFTLVEMTAVIAVLMVLAAVVLPRYAAMEAGQTSRDFQANLLQLGKQARLLAIETDKTVQVTYDSDQQMVVFSSVDPDTLELTQERTFPVPASVQLADFEVDGEFVSPTDFTLSFYPDGTGSDGAIEVDEGAIVYHVNVSGLDGTGSKVDGRIQDTTEPTKWQAGEIERRT